MFVHVCKMGLEGIVSKRRELVYSSGRSPDWIKSKTSRARSISIAISGRLGSNCVKQ